MTSPQPTQPNTHPHPPHKHISPITRSYIQKTSLQRQFHQTHLTPPPPPQINPSPITRSYIGKTSPQETQPKTLPKPPHQHIYTHTSPLIRSYTETASHCRHNQRLFTHTHFTPVKEVHKYGLSSGIIIWAPPPPQHTPHQSQGVTQRWPLHCRHNLKPFIHTFHTC